MISDECYLRFVYPPGEVFSAASLPAELRARLCIAGSFSKTYAMTGWRMGYALAPAEWTKAMLKVQGHSTSNRKLDRAMGRGRSLNWSTGISGDDAGGIHSAPRVVAERA